MRKKCLFVCFFLFVSLAIYAKNIEVLVLEGNISRAEFPVLKRFTKVNDNNLNFTSTKDRTLPKLSRYDILWIGQGEICENDYFLDTKIEDKIKKFVQNGGIVISMGQDSDEEHPCKTGWIPAKLVGVERSSTNNFEVIDLDIPNIDALFKKPNQIKKVHFDDAWQCVHKFITVATINSGRDMGIGLLPYGDGAYIVTSLDNETPDEVAVNKPIMENLLNFAVNLRQIDLTEVSSNRKSSLEQLSSEIQGAIIYTRHNQIYKVVIGKWEPVKLGKGEYARWGPNGKKIAVYYHRKIFTIDADGSNRRLITDEGWKNDGCPIEFHTNGREIIFIRRNKKGLWAVDIYTKEKRKLADLHDYTGEPGISENGKRIACRSGERLYAIDLDKKKDFLYLREGCSAGISPDGKWLMNNGNNGNQSHRVMNIRSWDGKTVKVLRARICQPDGEWDNHHWSNHNDYICAQGSEEGESYVIKLSAKRGTRVTWVGRTNYPDLYVAKSKNSSFLEVIPLDFFAKRYCMFVFGEVGQSDKPPVVLVNKNYNRTSSHVLIRRVLRPTRANLDYAAYDSNVMHYDPIPFELKSVPSNQLLSDLHFDNTIVPNSLRNHLDDTSLTQEEKVTPISWEPFTEHLMDCNFELGYKLAEVGWKISQDTWNDSEVPQPYQEISRVYLHKDSDGNYSLWIEVEFKPWVNFLENVDDEDKDSFPEIYGKLDSRFFEYKSVQKAVDEYREKLLSPEEVTDWATELATDWYDDYYTFLVEPEQAEIWPSEKTEPKVKTELDGLNFKQSDVVIRGKPFGETVYTVILIDFL